MADPKEDRAINSDLPSGHAMGKTICEGSIQAHQENDSHNPSNLPGPTVIPECKESDVKILRSCYYPDTQGALEELDWWIAPMVSCNGLNVLNQEPDLIMESDASQLGWGAVCGGTCTGGLWSLTECQAHINSQIDSNSICCLSILWEQEGCSHPSETGQPDSCGVYKPQWRLLISPVKQPGYPAVEVVYGAGTNPDSGTSTRSG